MTLSNDSPRPRRWWRPGVTMREGGPLFGFDREVSAFANYPDLRVLNVWPLAFSWVRRSR